ncbi:MAG: hypothetical protein KAW89_05815 [Armatimonadetes bacterium]|nr:hypothetical protein [Armatimonadota bacterium]
MADATVPRRALHGSLILCLRVATTAILTSCRTQYSPDRRLAGTSVIQVDDLKADVQLLNRLDDIGLSSAQMEDLIPVVNQLYSLEVQCEQRKKAMVTQMAPLLANKREMLVGGQPVSGAVDQQLEELETKVERIQAELAGEQEAYVQKVREILTPEQIDRLAGGSNAYAHACELLTWLREMPSSSYAEEAPVHAELLAAPELGLDAEVLRGIFDAVRNLPADEYASAQEGLAERIAPLYSAADEAETRAIVETFSNGRMATILREKADAMAK